MHHLFPRRAGAAHCALMLAALAASPFASGQRGPAPASRPPAATSAQPSDVPPAATSPAVPPSALGTPSSAGAPAAAPESPTGSLGIQPPAAPELPLSWDEFAGDYDPKDKPVSQRWLRVRAAFIELTDPPPSRDQTVFAMADLRPDLRETLRTKFIEFPSVVGLKSRYENVTLIDRDPQGRQLRYYDPGTKKYATFKLPFGTIIYFLAREETPQGLDFDFAYYDANTLNWTPSTVDDLLLPEPTTISAKQALQVPVGQYVFILSKYREGPPTPGSTARPVPLYGYVVLQIEDVSRTPATSGLGAPSGSRLAGTTLAAPVNRGAGAYPAGSYPPPAYPNSGYPQGYPAAGQYPASGQYPPAAGYPPQTGYPPASGYAPPPAGYQQPSGQYPQQPGYQQPPANYPPANQYPPAGGYPPSGGYPSGGYPPPSNYPPSTGGF